MANSVKAVKSVKNIPRAQVINIAHTLSHFSGKVTNTNIGGSGIRLDASVKVDLPYLSVSTLGAANVPLDFINCSRDSPAYKKIMETRATDKQIAAILDNPAINGLSKLTYAYARLRQVILPISERGDVALTPLSSTGLSSVIRNKTGQYSKDIERLIASVKANKGEKKNSVEKIQSEIRYHRSCSLDFGGSNSLNGGSMMFYAKSLLFFRLPRESIDCKAAYSAYYNGIQARILTARLNEYKQLLNASKVSIHEAKKALSNAEFEAKENALIKAIVTDIVAFAKQTTALIHKHLEIDIDSDEPLCVAKCNISKALLDKNYRQENKGWERQLAMHLRYRLIDAKVYNPLSGERESLGLSSKETNYLITKFEKEIRHAL